MPILNQEKGEHDCLSVNWKGVYFDVIVVKEENYNIIIIFTYSGLMVCEGQK